MYEGKLKIGDKHHNIKVISFVDPETNRIRVRPLPNQGLPSDILIECNKQIRLQNPIGTVFLAKSLKVCQKTAGRMYLRASNQEIFKIVEF